MKILFRTLTLLVAGPAAASVLVVGTVEQPVNLGALSDPSRIPLGPVVVETNHGYGSQLAISEPRPCTHGALAVRNGLELNMNLASAFGIEVVPEDETQVPQFPVTIKVRDWPVPAYSPYKKEHVLAATLHCLLRSVHAPPKTPLKILIDAENPEDAKNLAGFAGSYLTAEAEKHGGPTPVPGTRLDTDWRGVTYVVLRDGKAPGAEALRCAPPVLVPFSVKDGTDDLSYDLIPVWAGDTWKLDRLTILAQPVTLFYDYFDKTRSSGPDINSLTRLGWVTDFDWREGDDGSHLSLELADPQKDVAEDLPATLASICYAAVLTTQPTEPKPLTIRLAVPKALLDGPLAPFARNKDWKLHGGRTLSCTFAWNHAERTFLRGSIPLGRLEANLDRPWSVAFDHRKQVVGAASSPPRLPPRPAPAPAP